jgi:hypothetical protein
VDVLGRFEESSNQNPQEGSFLERERAREREIDEAMVGFEKKGTAYLT